MKDIPNYVINDWPNCIQKTVSGEIGMHPYDPLGFYWDIKNENCLKEFRKLSPPRMIMSNTAIKVIYKCYMYVYSIFPILIQEITYDRIILIWIKTLYLHNNMHYCIGT